MLTDGRVLIAPLALMLIGAGATFYLHTILVRQETSVIHTAAVEEAEKIGQLISFQTGEKMQSLRRMAQRWENSGGTPMNLWRADARNHAEQVVGLKAVEWVDATYRVRWVEPREGNESVIGLNIVFNEQRAQALQGARERGSITVTPPLDLMQGYKAFIVYIPIHIRQRFDGFIAGIFSTEVFFGSLVNREVASGYAVILSAEGQEFLRNNVNGVRVGEWTKDLPFEAGDKIWHVRVAPTDHLIASQRTSLPKLVLITGLLISLLLAMTLRYMLVSRQKSIRELAQQRAVERIKREFIAVVSHELRTPVTAIRGSLGIVSGPMKAQLPAKALPLIEMAARNSERLGTLIDDILDIEKLESGELQVKSVRVPVAAFLRQALEVNQSYGEKFQVRFELDAAPDSAEVLADPDRLMQVMSNLMSNAAKFSPAGSVVSIRAREHQSMVRFEVQDRGEGIDRAFHNRIFQKFAQADGSSSRRFKGTGLGLAITHQLVEKMGGVITFESVVGQGTTFYFDLPRATAMREGVDSSARAEAESLSGTSV